MKLNSVVTGLGMVFALVVAMAGNSDARVFSQRKLGIKKHEAHVQSVSGDHIRLKLESGASVPMRLSSLSEADRKYAAAWQRGQRELRLEVTAGSGLLKQILHGDPKVMLEPTDYHIQVKNKGEKDLSEVIFVYSIYYEFTERSPTGYQQHKFRKLGKRGVIKTDLIPKGATVGFVTQPIHISFTPHSGNRGEPFRSPGGIKSWRQKLKGIVVEAIVGGELVRVFEFEEGSDKPGAGLRMKGRSTLRDDKVWKGRNGAEFTGVFVKEEDGVLHILQDGKVTKVSKKNLSPGTLAWYDWVRSGETVVRPVAEIASNAYKPIGEIPEGATPALAVSEPMLIDQVDEGDGFELIDQEGLDRALIPVLDQSKYGQKASDCVPNSYAAFFLWWDQHSNLKIPKGRDFDDKAEWIHKELSRRFATRNNSGTKYNNLQTGLQEYFGRYYEDTAKFELKFDYDIRPENLAKLSKGGTGTILAVTIYNDRRKDGGHAMALVDAKPDGSITVNTWGKIFTGKIESLGKLKDKERPPMRTSPRERFEIKLDPDNDFPEWMTRRQVRFVLDPMERDCVQILTPYVKPKMEEE